MKQLRYFIVLAEELSFTRAARRLHLSQPALSVQIRHLERDIGADLLRRTSRSVELTEAGRGLHGDLRRVVADLDRACERARRTHVGAPAEVRLVHTASVAYEALPRILDALAGIVPPIEVVVRQAWSAAALDAVRAGDADLALVREFAGADGLVAEEVLREPLAVVMCARHPLAGRSRLAVADLRGHAVVAVPEEVAPGFHALVVHLCERRGFMPEEVGIAGLENREPLLAHLLRNPGHLFVGPASMATLAWDGVVHVPLADPDALMGLSVVRADGTPSPPVARAVGAVRAALSPPDSSR